MHVATLLTDPNGPPLDPSLAAALRNAWGGAEIRWLAPDQACEFKMPDVPGNADEVWSDLHAQRVDLVIQSAGRRRKLLLLADMDSTMIEQECIDELAAEAGVGERVAEITARAMNGELDFEGALIERVGLLKGLDASVIETVLKERITPAPGSETLVATMMAHGAYTALVSGGFTAFTASVAGELGFDEHRANTLLVQNGKLTGDVARPILGREAKVATLKELCTRLKIAESDVLAVGDGANDLGMLSLAGAGVALHAKPVVAAQAGIRINFGDLTALLYIQGYASDDFA